MDAASSNGEKQRKKWEDQDLKMMSIELCGGKFPPDSHAEGLLAYGNEFVAGPVAGSLQLCSMSQLFCQGEPPLGTWGHGDRSICLPCTTQRQFRNPTASSRKEWCQHASSGVGRAIAALAGAN